MNNIFIISGTTLRVSGAKGGPTNIIQLTGTSKQNAIAQFAVASQNNIIITSQPKLVVPTTSTTTTTTITTCSSTLTTTITTTSTKPVARITANKSQPQAITATKFPPKIAQQLINAKLITSDGQKIVQPKIYMSQQNQVKIASPKNIALTSKPVTLAATTNTIRMVNAANLNITHIGGKPVLLASKGTTIQNIQGQNVILQTQPNTSGGSLVLQQNTVKTIPTTQNNPSINIVNQQNMVLGPQLKMQTPQQVVFSSGVKSVTTQGHIVLEGHPVRLQTSTATNTQRVVLASQGQGGQIVAQQILLPAGFQGTAINIKALQGVKVIPIAQAHGQARGKSWQMQFNKITKQKYL